jgi:hypothetical protein
MCGVLLEMVLNDLLYQVVMSNDDEEVDDCATYNMARFSDVTEARKAFKCAPAAYKIYSQLNPEREESAAGNTDESRLKWLKNLNDEELVKLLRYRYEDEYCDQFRVETALSFLMMSEEKSEAFKFLLDAAVRLIPKPALSIYLNVVHQGSLCS